MSTAAIAGLAVAIVVAGALGWVFGRRRQRPGDPDAAMHEAAARLPGFDPVSAIVGEDNAGALAMAKDGRVALLSAARGRVRVREVAWTAVRATPAGIEVRPERGRRVLLAGVDALDIRRLAPATRVGTERPAA